MPAAVEVMESTPSSHGTMDSSNASDKKRNKLGYHRTSVACGQYLISGALPVPSPFFFNTSLVALRENALIRAPAAGLCGSYVISLQSGLYNVCSTLPTTENPMLSGERRSPGSM